MNLKEKLNKLSIIELVIIAEPHTDYTDEAKTYALDLLNGKNWENSPHVFDEIKKYWSNYISEHIKSILLEKNIPKSLFLSEVDIKEIVKVKFEEWKERQELLGIDITKYWAVPF
jgi:hypothetical protein|tara:strand:+ start:309 stop:653 length:345 start_codon:yes stop_codon:yes gene_type:complete